MNLFFEMITPYKIQCPQNQDEYFLYDHVNGIKQLEVLEIHT